MGWKVWLWVVLVVLTTCGEDPNKKRNAVQSKLAENLILETLDDQSRFEAKITHSPLGLAAFNGRLSMVRFGEPYMDAVSDTARKIDIKSGDSTFNLGLGASNTMQGVSITIYHWHGELGPIPIYNPRQAPRDGSVYAVATYSEIRRDATDKENDADWYTYRTTDGTVSLSVVQPTDDGGIKGSITMSVYLIDPAAPVPATIETLPKIRFEGSFNVRAGRAW